MSQSFLFETFNLNVIISSGGGSTAGYIDSVKRETANMKIRKKRKAVNRVKAKRRYFRRIMPKILVCLFHLILLFYL